MLLSSLSNTYFYYFVIQYIGDKMLNLVEPYIEKISKEDINSGDVVIPKYRTLYIDSLKAF